MNNKKLERQLLGYTKAEFYGTKEPVYLEGFSWDCGWYWGGGYVGNGRFHTHFDGCFLDVVDVRGHSLGRFVSPWDPNCLKDGYAIISNGCSIWEPIEFFLDEVPEHISKNWWRIKDLFKQFYALRSAAEVFKYGGHCTDTGRTAAELSPEMAVTINKHIEDAIIPEIIKAVWNK